MKYLSSLIVFVITFTCLSVAYADVALPPRPRNVQSDFITADIDDYGKLTIRFEFPADCDYEYQLIDRWENSNKEIQRKEIYSGKGSCKAGDVVEEVVDLNSCSRILTGQNYYILKVQLSNVKEKTRFGVKVRRGKSDVTKTILIEGNVWGNLFGLSIYDGDID